MTNHLDVIVFVSEIQKEVSFPRKE